MITKDKLKALFPKSPDAMVSAMAEQAEPLFKEFGLAEKPDRIFFFLAQIGHESGGGATMEENLNYSAPRMAAVWPNRFAVNPKAKPPQPNALAKKLERNPQALANNVYANRMGNGPEASGDGFRFRGRGLVQLTGRDGYENVGKAAGIDLVAAPDRASAPADALRVALGFWNWKKANPVCDTGDFTQLTKLVNGGIIGLAERQQWLAKARSILGPNPLGA
jgi:putative chitinase